MCVCVYVMNEESMCDKDWCLTIEFSNLKALDGHWVAFMWRVVLRKWSYGG